MPTTRRQAAGVQPPPSREKKEKKPAEPGVKRGRGRPRKDSAKAKEDEGKEEAEKQAEVGEKRDAESKEAEEEENDENQPPSKKAKTAGAKDWTPLSGTIERGHIYFFYRPKVEVEEASSIDEVRNMHIILVPRPPEFATTQANGAEKSEGDQEGEMDLLSSGADAVPSEEPKDKRRKHFRVITVGKKQLPDPESGGAGKGRKETFWASVTTVGEDLEELESGMEAKEYETKTRGTRHEGANRLAARGVYAIVNNDPSVPSKRETHLGYHLTHPSPSELGDVQTEMRIYPASSFVITVRNPLAQVSAGQNVGLPQGKRADYPPEVMRDVFGQGEKGTTSNGLRFSSVNRPELLDFQGAELLLIGARAGEEALETSLGEGRGEALQNTSEKESKESIDEVLRELSLDARKIPADPLKGEWL